MGNIDAARTNRGHRRFRMLLAWITVAAGFAVATPMIGTPSVEAVSVGTHGDRIVNFDPVNNTPHALDGYVRTFAEVPTAAGMIVLVGGNFTQTRTAASTTVVPRSYLFSYNKGTGAITSLNPTLNGEIFSIVPTGDGETVWIAGGFSSLNGQTVRTIAKININTGQRVSQFSPPAFNGRIQDLALRNGRLYVTGRFTAVGSSTRTLLAALDPTTGALIPEVAMSFSEPRRNGALTISASDITPDGSKLVAIGNFTKIEGADRYQIGVIDLDGPAPALADWATDRYGNGCSSSFQSYMRDVEASPDGKYFAVVTTGAYSQQYLCDTAARWDFAASGTDVEPVWTNYTGGDTVTAVAVTERAVYVGGHNGWMNNPYAGDRIGAGAVLVEGLTALDARSGGVLDWFPHRTLGYGVYGFLVVDDGLYIGSDTERINGWEYRSKLAFMPLAGGHELPAEHTGTLPGQTVTITTSDVHTRTFTGTSATGAGSTNANGWSGLRGAFMVSGELYTGWSDRTFKVQDYDGTTFGPRMNIPLQLLTAADPGGAGNPADSNSTFSTQDLATITAMFYEEATGRIYYTRSGQSTLFHRSFALDTHIVGAHRQNGPGNISGLNWQNVRGMFLAGEHLYVADSNGRLTRWDWSPTGGPADTRNLSPAAYSGTPVEGSGVVVSGTGDGLSWNGLDTFLYASADGPPNVPPVADVAASCTGAACDFSGAGSTDPDGTITSYAWDFGDGTSPGTGVSATHVYAASGSYTVTLTVTDDRGGTDTDTLTVDVAIPNQPPTANFTSSCPGLTCSFDGSASSDLDGTIANHSWDFGDGTTDTGPTVSRTYSEPGTYNVALTVTDDDGAPNTRTTSVSVIDPDATPTVGFVAAAGSNGNSTVPDVTVPPTVLPGDRILVIASIASLTPTVAGPAGYTPLGGGTNATAGTQTYAWEHEATGGDAGSTIELSLSSIAKYSLEVVVYRNVGAVGPAEFAFDTESRTERTTPAVTVTTPGSALISYWSDKSSGGSGWIVPTGVTERDQQIGVGGGRVASAVADTLGLAPGPNGGLVGVSDTANRRGMIWSIVLAPSTGAVNAPPMAAFTPTCAGLTCAFTSASSDSDGEIVSHAWDFGDGATSTDTDPSHTFGAAGTVTVTLTVTDDHGAPTTTTREVTVSDAPGAVVGFRAAASSNANTSVPRVTIPPTVEDGDVLVMFATLNSRTPTITAPAGWTELNAVNNSTLGGQTVAWWRRAAAGDAGTVVGPDFSSLAKVSLQLVAYSNADAVTAHATAVQLAVGTSRTTPTTPVADAGSILVSYWADRTSNSTELTAPATAALRDLSVGSGGGRIVAAVADTGSLAPGSAGGLTATSDSSNARVALWSVVIAPA